MDARVPEAGAQDVVLNGIERDFAAASHYGHFLPGPPEQETVADRIQRVLLRDVANRHSIVEIGPCSEGGIVRACQVTRLKAGNISVERRAVGGTGRKRGIVHAVHAVRAFMDIGFKKLGPCVISLRHTGQGEAAGQSQANERANKKVEIRHKHRV